MEPYDGDDEESAAVLRTVGRVVKTCRERKGLTQADLGAAIGYSEEQVSSVERLAAARLARQRIIGEKGMIPAFNFVQDEAALRRPVGGKMVLRRQLEHLLGIGQMRNVEIQVLPLDREDNAGLDGPFHLLRLKEGITVGHTDIQLVSRLISDRREVQILELRYGIIRAQALTPRESLAYIEKLLGET
ncbi:helix-turn-helix domain-containing protein [Streptomyces sp. NPDC002559]